MEKISAELVVIGAGPGGYVAALKGAQLGLDTVVIEDGQIGGVCLNWGCIPSKALIQAADTFHRLHKEIPNMGISVGEPSVDAAKMQDWKDKIVQKLTGGIGTLFKSAGVKVVNGRARLTGPTTAVATTKDGEVEVSASKGLILATGGAPINLPGLDPDGQDIITAKEAVNLRQIPGRLAVIGGGVIGLELGTVYRKLGAEVTVIELMDQVLPGFDPEIVNICARRLKQLKVQVLTGSKATAAQKTDQGLAVTVRTGDKEQTVVCDQLLVAVGMRPATAGLGLEELGVATERGAVVVDDHCQTNLPGLYAIGDLVGQPMLAHKASFEGEIAVEAIAGQGHRHRKGLIPGAVFTDPEIGAVGLTEPQATQAGHELKIGRFFFGANGKAMALQEIQGLAKVVADAKTDQVLGVHLIGAHASDLLAEATQIVAQKLTLSQAAHVVRAHPTLAEVLLEALLDANGMAIHAARK